MTNDVHMALESLHEDWAVATEELETIYGEWRTEFNNSELRERYFAKQDVVLKLVQKIMALKRKIP